ncbi:hypothetical protein L1887_36440 [Cichorium endivia]|nr:hypothetical protein L1887_36440 [Cichorium endivia]
MPILLRTSNTKLLVHQKNKEFEEKNRTQSTDAGSVIWTPSRSSPNLQLCFLFRSDPKHLIMLLSHNTNDQ